MECTHEELHSRIGDLTEIIERFLMLPSTDYPTFPYERHTLAHDAKRLVGNPCVPRQYRPELASWPVAKRRGDG